MEIRVDPVEDPRVMALLRRHLDEMHTITPAGSVHALDIAALRAPEMMLWSAWEGETLLGTGGLKDLGGREGELKSFHTIAEARGRGVGYALLAHAITTARRRGYRRLSLETGSTRHFRPAQRLYEARGFGPCGPFADYAADPHSLFLTLEL